MGQPKATLDAITCPGCSGLHRLWKGDLELKARIPTCIEMFQAHSGDTSIVKYSRSRAAKRKVLSTQRTVKEAIAISSILAVLSLVPALVPVSHAYGIAQFQVGFSGNCNNVSLCGGGVSGFWGWCEFGGSTSKTTGTDADCQITFYFFNHTGGPSFGPITDSIRGTQWSLAPGAGTPIFGVPDFFITDGTVTVSGPVVFQHTGSGQPVTFTVAQAIALGIITADTFIPLVPGHLSFSLCFGSSPPISAPGCHFDQQLTVIP